MKKSHGAGGKIAYCDYDGSNINDVSINIDISGVTLMQRMIEYIC